MTGFLGSPVFTLSPKTLLSDEGGKGRSSPIAFEDRPSASRTATLEERRGGLEGPETSQRNLDSCSEVPFPLSEEIALPESHKTGPSDLGNSPLSYG